MKREPTTLVDRTELSSELTRPIQFTPNETSRSFELMETHWNKLDDQSSNAIQVKRQKQPSLSIESSTAAMTAALGSMGCDTFKETPFQSERARKQHGIRGVMQA